MDALLRALNVNLAEGLELLDAAQLAHRAPAADLPLVVLGVNGATAVTVVPALARRYPAEHLVTVYRAGMAQQVRVGELENQDWADYVTSLYLPPLKPSTAGESNPRGWVQPTWPADPLVEVMVKLRAPEGCPWDREQSHQTLRRYMLEEAYEAVEAIDSGNPALLCEELGDVLLQVVFHAQVAKEAGTFDFHDVVEGITAKLVRRHPHVFGDVVAETAEDVTRNWEAIKRTEKGDQGPESVLGKVSGVLPALSRANEVQRRAAKVGFDWDDIAGPVAKVREELAEVLAATPAEREGELGDLLFAVVNLARMLKIDPEVALTVTTTKFIQRFHHIERRVAEKGRKMAEMTLAELDEFWNEAKTLNKSKNEGKNIQTRN